jgi:outer membrane protein assembly factor BamB
VAKPAGDDIWVSGSEHIIGWNSFGAVFVDISFSKNSGDNWQIIETNVPDTGIYNWHLPDIIDSNECLIAVIPTSADPNITCIHSGLFTIHPDNPDPAVESKWKSLGGDFKRTGLSENYGPEFGCVKWKFETDGAVSTSVTVGVDETVHIGCEDGKLYTLDANGVLLWSYDANSPLLSSPTIGPDGTVYVGSKAGKLYAIDINGNLRWTHTTEGFIYSSSAVSPDGKVYVCSQDGILYALGQDGSELWSFETGGFGMLGGSILASPAIAADGTVYIGGLYDPNLYALNPDDGSLKWVCGFESQGWPFTSPVVAADGIIYQMLVYDSNLYAIEPNTGTIVWSTNLADPCSGWFGPDYDDKYSGADGWSEPVLAPDGTIYAVLDEDPYLRAVNPDGNIKWVTRLGYSTGLTLTVGGNGLIYAANDDNTFKVFEGECGGGNPIYISDGETHVYVVDAKGRKTARFDSDDWLSFPVVAANGTMIVGEPKDHTRLISDANNTVWAIGRDGCDGQVFNLHWLEDLNADGAVNFADFALLTADWLNCTDMDSPCNYCDEEIPSYGGAWNQRYLAGDVDRNLYVNFADFAALANRWLNVE